VPVSGAWVDWGSGWVGWAWHGDCEMMGAEGVKMGAMRGRAWGMVWAGWWCGGGGPGSGGGGLCCNECARSGLCEGAGWLCQLCCVVLWGRGRGGVSRLHGEGCLGLWDGGWILGSRNVWMTFCPASSGVGFGRTAGLNAVVGGARWVCRGCVFCPVWVSRECMGVCKWPPTGGVPMGGRLIVFGVLAGCALWGWWPWWAQCSQ